MSQPPVRVFVSYRAEDREWLATLITRESAARFGHVVVADSVPSIEIGADVIKSIDRAIRRCDVLLVIIGPGWLDARDAAGNRQLDRPADSVRHEIALALEMGKHIVPVLSDNADIPASADLPQEISAIAGFQAARIRSSNLDQDLDLLFDLLASLSSSNDDRSGVRDAPAVATAVGWSTDAPADIDMLRRDALAEVLAGQIKQSRQREPQASLLVHLDGPWGAGKSTLLKLLSSHLRVPAADSVTAKPVEFLIVWFDAWQQARMSPPWWALLTAARHEIASDHRWSARRWFRLRETWERARRSGGPFALAMTLLLAAAAATGLFAASIVTPGQSWSELIKISAASLAGFGLLWSGTRVASRMFLWDSARGARLFEMSDTNPMSDIAHHFAWLLRQSRKPVVFFVDDLDRCTGEYVVQFLDVVQTLVRDAPRTYGPPSERDSAACFVVAADGAWLRRSYETAYAAFHDCTGYPGSTLGHLFLDKLFQLSVPMPVPSAPATKRYLGRLLGLSTSDTAVDLGTARNAIAAAEGDEGAILHSMTRMRPEVREAVGLDAARALASPQARVQTEHALRKFSALLDPNPRRVKLFLNTYSMLRSVRTLEGIPVAADTLALWAIVRVRWPSIADFLQHQPEAVRGIRDPLWSTDLFPDSLHAFARDDDLRLVVQHAEGGPLTAHSIRQCCGTADREP